MCVLWWVRSVRIRLLDLHQGFAFTIPDKEATDFDEDVARRGEFFNASHSRRPRAGRVVAVRALVEWK